MAGHNSIDPLLAVQQQRVNRAMGEVQLRNEQLQRAQFDRDLAHTQWLEARAGLDRERRDQSRALAGRVKATVLGSELITAAGRIEWWRLRVDDRKKLLESADAALVQSQTAAAAARRLYMETYAKYQAILKLANERQYASAQVRSRIVEHAADDLIANRSAKG